jgi:hypothetical protein
MKRAPCLLTLLSLAITVTALAVDLPLEFKQIPPAQVREFPGGYGAYGQLRANVPEALKKQAKAKSKCPLFAEFDRRGEKSMLARLDESSGDGKGYDELIVDLNGNGDLTDDKPISIAAPSKGRTSDDMLSFGPVTVPGAGICGGSPTIYGELYLANLELLRSLKTDAERKNFYAGQVMLKSGWFLQAKTTQDGSSRLIGIYDGNASASLGDFATTFTYTNQGQVNWYFNPGDAFLVDADKSGKFTSDNFSSELCPFASLLYLGPSPMQVKLAPDCKGLSVVPWQEALAEVSLGAQPKQVRTVTLAWRRGNAEWQLIRPVITDGKVKVPPGEYRLYACSLLDKEGGGRAIMVAANQRVPKTPLRFEAGQASTFKMGGPLGTKVTASKRKPQPWENTGMAGTSRDSKGGDSDFVLAINANVVGDDGEVYHTFGTGDGLRDRPERPTFTVTGANGKELARGSLEYG